MGFKSVPWELYYKPSLDEFVIRQRHTLHESAAVKAINGQLKAHTGKDSAPARVAHRNAVNNGYARYKIKYVNGQRKWDLVADIRAFKAELGKAMLATIQPVDGGDTLPSRGGSPPTLPARMTA
jgi:hypothetical protein